MDHIQKINKNHEDEEVLSKRAFFHSSSFESVGRENFAELKPENIESSDIDYLSDIDTATNEEAANQYFSISAESTDKFADELFNIDLLKLLKFHQDLETKKQNSNPSFLRSSFNIVETLRRVDFDKMESQDNLFQLCAKRAVPWGSWPTRLRNHDCSHLYDYFDDLYHESLYEEELSNKSQFSVVRNSNETYTKKIDQLADVNTQLTKRQKIDYEERVSIVPIPLRCLLQESWYHEAEKGYQLGVLKNIDPPAEGSLKEKAIIAEIESMIELIVWATIARQHKRNFLQKGLDTDDETEAIASWIDILSLFKNETLELYSEAIKDRVRYLNFLPSVDITTEVLERTAQRIGQYYHTK